MPAISFSRRAILEAEFQAAYFAWSNKAVATEDGPQVRFAEWNRYVELRDELHFGIKPKVRDEDSERNIH